MMYVTVARAQQNKYLAQVSSTILTERIKAASAMIAKYCDNDFTNQAYTDVLDGLGLPVIQLGQVGLSVLTSVNIQEGTTDNSIAVGSFTSDASTGRLGFAESNTSSFYVFPRGYQNITVVYTAGETHIPEDVQEATVQLTYNLSVPNDSKVSPSVKSLKMGEYSEALNDTTTTIALNQSVKDLLFGHIRFEV